MAGNRRDILRAGAPGHGGGNIGGIQDNILLIDRAFIGGQAFPPRHGTIPIGPLGGQRTALEIGKGCFIRRNKASTRPGLNRHVANRHPAFHRQGTNGIPGKFNDITGAARRADMANNRQHNILGGDTGAGFAVHGDAHIFGLFHQQGLGGQHMLNLRRANPKGQRTKSPMG